MASYEEEPPHKRQKFEDSVQGDGQNDSNHNDHLQGGDKSDGLPGPLSLKVETGHEMIDSEIINQQRAQEEQEKAAEEARQKEYLNDGPDGSLDHDGDDQGGLKDGSSLGGVNTSMSAAIATAALRSSSAGPDSLSTPTQQSPSLNLGQNAAAALTSLSHTGLGSHHQNISSNSPSQNIDLALAAQYQQPRGFSQGLAKPAVGSEEWHRQRRDNHKEVERRRRETINDGIRELSELVPNCEKNKGQILRRAVDYIRELKDTEAARMEKWTMDKILSEQAISEVSASNEKLKGELERAWKEVGAWKKLCQDAGISKPPTL